MKCGGYLLIAAVILLHGCAASTRGPVHQASTAAQAGASAPTSTQALTPVLTTADDPRLMAANRYAREMGYKIEQRHGVQFYCRTTAPLGSRLTEKQCLTVDGMAQAKQITDQNRTALELAGRLCGPACVGN
jgi:hypothetical protein